MKFVSSTVLVGVLSLLSASTPGAEAANRHAGTRRQLDLQDGQLQKRVPLASNNLPPIEVGPKLRLMRRSALGNAKRAPLAAAEPAANAGFGAVPIMNIGTAPIVGMVNKRGSADAMGAHNGQQGVAVSSSASGGQVSSSNSGGSSSSSGSTTSSGSTGSSSSDGDDDEDCDAEDDGDDDDAEDCDDDEEDDAEDDCDEDDTGDSSTSTADSSSSSTSSSNASSGSSSTSDSSSSNDSSSGLVSAQVSVNALKEPTSGSNNSSNSNSGNGNGNGNGSSTSSSSQSSESSSSSGSSSSGSSGSGNSQVFTGISTWYTQNGNAGACGKVNPDSAHVIALYTSAYANGANCGRTVEIQNLDDGTSTTATVADECPSCGGPGDIDLSVGTFSAIDPNYQQDGVRNIKWWFTS